MQIRLHSLFIVVAITRFCLSVANAKKGVIEIKRREKRKNEKKRTEKGETSEWNEWFAAPSFGLLANVQS